MEQDDDAQMQVVLHEVHFSEQVPPVDDFILQPFKTESFPSLSSSK